MTEDYRGLQVPGWFISKYPQYHYSWSTYQPLLSIASRSERKFYGVIKDEELFLDLQKILVENEFTGELSVVMLHECGGITIVFITKDKIVAREPLTWKEVESVEHDYCYGCSLPDSLKSKR